MSTVQEIEEAIRNLPPSDLITLRDWFATLEGELLEEQMESVLIGIEQAENGDWVDMPPNYKADMEEARSALEKFLVKISRKSDAMPRAN